MTRRLLPVALVLGACAVGNGAYEPVAFESVPSGAFVTVSNEQVGMPLTCRTPCSLNVPTTVGPLAVRFDLDGYETGRGRIENRQDVGVGTGASIGLTGIFATRHLATGGTRGLSDEVRVDLKRAADG